MFSEDIHLGQRNGAMLIRPCLVPGDTWAVLVRRRQAMHCCSDTRAWERLTRALVVRRRQAMHCSSDTSAWERLTRALVVRRRQAMYCCSDTSAWERLTRALVATQQLMSIKGAKLPGNLAILGDKL